MSLKFSQAITKLPQSYPKQYFWGITFLFSAIYFDLLRGYAGDHAPMLPDDYTVMLKFPKPL